MRGGLARLGNHKTGKDYLYIKRLADVKQDVLAEVILKCIVQLKKNIILHLKFKNHLQNFLQIKTICYKVC